MAFSAELVAKLGLDPSAFQRGLAQAEQAAGSFGKALDRKIGMGDAFKSFVAAIGISVESLAEKVAEAWVGGTREGLEKVAQLVEENSRAIEEKILRRMPDEKSRRAQIDKWMKDAVAEANRPRGSRTEREVAMGADFKVRTGAERTIWTESEEAYVQRTEAAKKRIFELEKLQEASDSKRKQETDTLDNQLAAASEARLLRELEAGKKVDHLAFRKLLAEKEVERAAEGSAEQKRAQIELERISLQLLEAEAAQQAEIKRNQEEQLRIQKEAERTQKQLRDAEKRVGAAQGELAGARDDMLGVSIQEAAAGKGGATQSSKAAARRILSLEARARRIAQSGNSDFRDPNGKKVSAQDYAQQLMSRAEALRNSSGYLREADRDPLKAYKEALTKAEELLEEIRKSLVEESEEE